jgi:2,3-bisphosphoglycerate-dependent phosphoglycerate mutase
MKILIMLRHGESEWNDRNVFTGWTDVDLSEKGCEEAREAGRLLKMMGYGFDVAYTSKLKRSIRTLWHVLDKMDLMWIPVYRTWRLNERNYGIWQGRNKTRIKTELFKIYGSDDRFDYIHRGFDGKPDKLSVDDQRYPGHDPRYQHLKKKDIPRSESLKDAIKRVRPYWEKRIDKKILKGDRILVVGHNTSLRALFMCFHDFNGVVESDEFMDDEKLKELGAFKELTIDEKKAVMIVRDGLQNAVPLVCEFDDDNNFLRCYYLSYPKDKAYKEDQEIRGNNNKTSEII